MRDYACSEARFLGDIARHEMTVIRDDGVYRHIRFKRPDSGSRYFDLVSWPGHLCYTGDMGTYVFCCQEDMFQFFRADREWQKAAEARSLAINPGYWSEKVKSDSRFGKGTECFSEELFRKALRNDFDNHFEGLAPDADASAEEREDFVRRKAEAWDEVEDQILGVDSLENEGVCAALDFEHDGVVFTEFWYHRLTDYTFYFVWCCYALAWGIRLYDDATKRQGEDDTPKKKGKAKVKEVA